MFLASEKLRWACERLVVSRFRCCQNPGDAPSQKAGSSFLHMITHSGLIATWKRKNLPLPTFSQKSEPKKPLPPNRRLLPKPLHLLLPKLPRLSLLLQSQ